MVLKLNFFKDCFYFQREGRAGEREGEKHQCVVASCAPLTGDPACNTNMCLDWELNQQPFGSQAGTQSTEPHQPGLEPLFLKTIQTFLPGVANIKGPRKYKKMCK